MFPRGVLAAVMVAGPAWSAIAQNDWATYSTGMVTFQWRIAMDVPGETETDASLLPGQIGFWLQARTMSTTAFNPGLVRASSPPTVFGQTSLIRVSDPAAGPGSTVGRGSVGVEHLRGLAPAFRFGTPAGPTYNHSTENGPMQGPAPQTFRNENGYVDGTTIAAFDAFIGTPRAASGGWEGDDDEPDHSPFESMAGAGQYTSWQNLYRFYYQPGPSGDTRQVTVEATAWLMGAYGEQSFGGLWALMLTPGVLAHTTFTFTVAGDSGTGGGGGTEVPAPAAAALLLLGGLHAARRRR